jgi:hypothetical protein
MLTLDMTEETAAHLFVLIRDHFRKRNWPLPEESGELAEFQRFVPQGPRRSPERKKS